MGSGFQHNICSSRFGAGGARVQSSKATHTKELGVKRGGNPPPKKSNGSETFLFEGWDSGCFRFSSQHLA